MVGPAALWPPFVKRHTQAAGKGTHALVIGVSAYDNLPPLGGDPEAPWKLVQLESAATAALLFAEWLNEEYRSGESAPLRSLRVLLSPSNGESQRLGERLGGAPTATMANVLNALEGWSDDLERSKGSTSLIYLAGHGVANDAQHNLLLQDLSPKLNLTASVNITSVLGSLEYYKLDASYAFIDTCADWLPRNRKLGSGGLELAHELKDTVPRRGDHRFFAAARGGQAKGHPDVGSIFGHELLHQLGKAVTRTSDGTWAVTPEILAARLTEWTKRNKTEKKWTKKNGVSFWLETRSRDTLSFQLPEGLPEGVIKVTLAPPASAPNYTLGVFDQDDESEYGPIAFDPHPWTWPIDPGLHAVELTPYGRPPLRRKMRTVEAYQVQEYAFKDDQR